MVIEGRFKDKIVVITGAANGLGHGMAERFVAEGAKVAALDIELDTLERVFADNDAVIGIECDVSDYEQVHAAIAQVIEQFGRIDILMNNAGITMKDDKKTYCMLNCPKEAWERVIDINLNGAFFVGQAVARQFVAQGDGGVIVNTASNAAFSCYEDIGAYSPSKAGVAHMTSVWAKELAQYNIRVNAFAPGTSLTRISLPTRTNPYYNDKFLEGMPFHRYGEIEEAVAVALFLASDEASFVTGETWREDGGQHL